MLAVKFCPAHMKLMIFQFPWTWCTATNVPPWKDSHFPPCVCNAICKNTIRRLLAWQLCWVTWRQPQLSTVLQLLKRHPWCRPSVLLGSFFRSMADSCTASRRIRGHAELQLAGKQATRQARPQKVQEVLSLHKVAGCWCCTVLVETQMWITFSPWCTIQRAEEVLPAVTVLNSSHVCFSDSGEETLFFFSKITLW